MFARHGFAHASVQQIADASGHTKPGLLYYYPSKEALFEAVLDALKAQTDKRVAKLSQIPAGFERDLAMIEDSIDQEARCPGMAAMGHQLSREDTAEDPRIFGALLDLLEVLGIDLEAPDFERTTRILSALSGANLSMRLAISMKAEAQMRPHIIAVAMETCGHGRALSEQMRG